MRKILFWCLGAIILLIYLYTQRNCIYNFFSTEDNATFFSNIGNFTEVFVALISVLNIIIIIFIFKSDRKYRNILDNNVRQDKIIQSKLFWYRSIILDKNFEEIELFFSQIDDTVGFCKVLLGESKTGNNIDESNQSKIKERLSRYTCAKMKIEKSLNNIIKVIDPNVAGKLDDLNMEYQDIIFKNIALLFLDPEGKGIVRDIESQVANYKREFYLELYSFELSLNKEHFQNV